MSDLQPSAPVIAVFDFDGTLVANDSFWPFLGYAVGWPRTAWVFLQALGEYAKVWLKDKNDPEISDHRTFLKAYLLQHLLAGRSLESIQPAAVKLLAWRKWKENIRDALLEHHAAGHHVVVASGGLDLYLPGLLADLPHHALICTKVGVANGVLTGEMISGNCVRHRKAELVAEYIAQNGPFGESWGYGNLPHDLPMMELVRHRIIV